MASGRAVIVGSDLTKTDNKQPEPTPKGPTYNKQPAPTPPEELLSEQALEVGQVVIRRYQKYEGVDLLFLPNAKA